LTGAEEAVSGYLQAWQGSDFARMYTYLSPSAQASIAADSFTARYEAITEEATILSLTATASPLVRTGVASAAVPFTIAVETGLAGPFRLDNELRLSYDGQRWGIDWTTESIVPLLGPEKLVHMFVHTPSRATIYDRRGVALAVNENLIELGVVPGRIEDEAQLLQVLSGLLSLPQDVIQSRYISAGRPDWFMPVGEITAALAKANESQLASIPGITWREKAIRTYPQGDLAAQVVGYMARINADTLERLRSSGYTETDMLGVSGLEGWGESYLGGTRGGTLAIISADGRIVWTLSEKPAKSSASLFTTLDVQLQRAAEGILGERLGAIAVIDVRNGEVLALASYPRYDPGELTAGTPTGGWEALLNDVRHPFLDRAIAGVYPPGSTFKIVTMSAGLQELGLSQNKVYYCAGPWTGLSDGATRTCWVPTGHGSLTLFQGLAQSCDTVFWEVGKALNERDPFVLSRYARGFGLGQTSGLNALHEAQGLIPDPDWKSKNYTGAEQAWLPRDAVNMAIGQGDVLATPLQMANLVAAVANGGTLFKPRLIREISSSMDGVLESYGPQVAGQLPVSAANLQIVQRGMEAVVTQGTAQRAFYGAAVRMAGKSGTSEAPPGEPHGWFVGYAPADNPQIAVAVVLEHGGEGGRNAAPLFRQVIEAYLALPPS
jgi:penicillin-binding protein 2